MRALLLTQNPWLLKLVINLILNVYNMRILTGEIKKNGKIMKQTIVDIPLNKVHALLEKDNQYVEVIPMFYNNQLLRIYVDIDSCNIEPSTVLSSALAALNAEFRTVDGDWAVCSCHRPDGDKFKVSFHILSKIYCMQLENLRKCMLRLKEKVPCIDTTVYWFFMDLPYDEGFFRLPNQSKDSINKSAPPLKIECGEIRDFIVTDTQGLTEFK